MLQFFFCTTFADKLFKKHTTNADFFIIFSYKGKIIAARHKVLRHFMNDWTHKWKLARRARPYRTPDTEHFFNFFSSRASNPAARNTIHKKVSKIQLRAPIRKKCAGATSQTRKRDSLITRSSIKTWPFFPGKLKLN